MIDVLIQARTGSTRLPGKVLMKINEKPMLWYIVNRLKLSGSIDRIIVATTKLQEDNSIELLCDQWNIPCFRGETDNVLDRYYQAAKKFNVKNIIRITADCPLLDFRLVDEMVEFYQKKNCDYLSNTLKPFYPDGMDVEIFTFQALEKAWKESDFDSEKEHVTPYIWKNSTFKGKDLFNSFNYDFSSDFSHFRLTVDEKEDFEVIKFLIENSDLKAPWLDYVSLLTKNQQIMKLNMQFKRNEGYEISLLNEVVNSESNKVSANIIMQDRAKNRIPGMTQLLSKRPDQFSLGVWPTYYKKAKGVEVWDLDGRRYIDMSISGIGANVLGYSDPHVDDAVINAVRNGSSSSLNCPEEVELGDLLCKLHPWADKVRYARTGGESMTIAVRIARAFTGKDKLAFCGYHGWHDWYLSANLTEPDALGEHVLPGLKPCGVPGALKNTAFPFRYNKLDDLESIVKEHQNDLGAIILEPIRNDNPVSGFLERIREIANETKAVIIVDEISAGFRMNSGGAHLLFNFEPDIAVFSKALGNGYPIGAIIGKKEIMDAAQNTFISSTNWTERIGPVAALETIRKHKKENVGRHLVYIGNRIQRLWNELSEKHSISIQVGGIPPLSHFTFQYENALNINALFIQLMLKKGFLASTTFYSMFAHNEIHVEKYAEALDEVFQKLKKIIEMKQVEKYMKGQSSVEGFKRLI